MGTITSWMISFPYIFTVSGMAIFAYILLAIFFASEIQMAYNHALLWISSANPFLWMTAARCANAAAGISDGCVVVRGIMPHASVYRDVLRSADARLGLTELG